jgi:large subunit ribosomal protein L30
MATLQVTQRRSSVGSNKRQLDTLRSLGLRRIGHTVEVKDCEQARGMVHAVRHLVEVHPEGHTSKGTHAGTQAGKQGQSS